MPIDITQGRYTRDAIKGMIVKPEDRADAVARLLSKIGVGCWVIILLSATMIFSQSLKSRITSKWRQLCWRPAAAEVPPTCGPPLL